MALLFYFSSKPYHKQDLRPRLHHVVSEKVITDHFSGINLQYGGSEISVRHEGPYGFVEFFIRKGAHFTIYLFLGLFLMRAFSHSRISRRYIWLYALLLAAFYAGTDEFHQSITGDRTPLVSDVVLDTIGAAAGIGIMLLSYIRNNRELR